MEQKISMLHGSGGRSTGELIDNIFAKEFDNDTLNEMEDSAVVSGSGKIAITTDSFVVTPLEFRGGDLGRLAVCGTVNDLLMRGAVPKYLTCGWILEEGAELDVLKRLVHSMAETAREVGIKIVCGDTKVIEGHGGIYVNTAGVGFVSDGVDISAKNAKAGDVIIASGNMGDHHSTILSDRLSIVTDIASDNAPLTDMVLRLIGSDVEVHTLRDVTRGGLATVLKELAESSENCFSVDEEKIPVSDKVRDFAALLGLDPMYMGNEGKMVCIVPQKDAEKALSIIRGSKYGDDACIIGRVENSGMLGNLFMNTSIGGKRNLTVLEGEGLPRIC